MLSFLKSLLYFLVIGFCCIKYTLHATKRITDGMVEEPTIEPQYTKCILQFETWAKQFNPDIVILIDKDDIVYTNGNQIFINGLFCENPWYLSKSSNLKDISIHNMFGNPEHTKAIILHELGHIYHDHICLYTWYGIIMIIIIITLHKSKRYNQLYLIIGCALVLEKFISRQHEYQADLFAVQNGYGPQLIENLKNFEIMNDTFGPPTFWDQIWGFVDYHPSVADRVSYMLSKL